jgi:hypothetical protein
MTRKLRPVLGALTAIGAGVLAILLLTLIVRTWSLADAIRETQKSNTGAVKLIRDCTDPSGDCYKRGQKQTAVAVADINKISVYAAACADRPGVQTASEIYACVVERLAQDKP